ncbi:MAG: chromosomal replication initiator protein DnaA [Hydrogenophilaceae bacterium]|nr:chromosomal replication initiator protein DnaA [Hydrogenophilaceae bacterium]
MVSASPTSFESFWDNCLARLRSELTPQQFNTWIKPLSCHENDGVLLISAPNRFVLDWIRDKFSIRLEEWAQDYYGAARTLEFSLQPKSAGQQSSTNIPLAVSSPSAGIQPENSMPGMRINPQFTFDTFVSGRANQLARAAAMQITENPGLAYNPMFIYGGVGLGKTHLLQAIGNQIRLANPAARISYIHANDYVNDMVKAYRHRNFEDFKKHYLSLDVLLIDDIQFFAQKDRTQEEFFYVFNGLIENKKQIVITSDTFPKDLAGIEDRLKSRFAWGLTVAIEPPELEMRVAILQKKAQTDNIKLDENVAFFIAKQVRSNVRELEGALKRVVAYARFTEKPMTLDLVKDALRDLIASAHKQVSIENIQKTVADFYKIKVADMFSKKRTRNLARPRQIAMALAKELTHLSLPEIGDAFGGRDHTTVLHACRKVAELREQEQDISRDYLVLLQTLTS